ncbi:hypothetical protein ABWE39_004255 [Salmonella enterica subsp. enterica]
MQPFYFSRGLGKSHFLQINTDCPPPSDNAAFVKAAFAVALRRAWSHAKVSMERAIEDAKIKASYLRSGRRYLELLEIAERDGLNHGKSWVQNEMAMNFGGQVVCYVYAN